MIPYTNCIIGHWYKPVLPDGGPTWNSYSTYQYQYRGEGKFIRAGGSGFSCRRPSFWLWIPIDELNPKKKKRRIV